MRAPPERTMRDLYDRTRHKDLAAPVCPADGRGRGCAEGSRRRELVARMEDKTIVRKRLISNDNICVKSESGTCNVCYAPCSSCLHRSLGHADSNIDCVSSQTCSARSQIKHSSLVRNEKGVLNRGENEDEFSAASSNASYSETGGNKVVSRSSIAEDSSEVDMPAKRRRLSKQDMKLSRVEYLDDNNSCVTGMAAEGKLLEKKKLSTSASSRGLIAKECRDNSSASHNRLRKLHANESTEKNQSDVMRPSSSIMAKKLLRTQSSVSASKGLSPKRQALELGEAQENVSRRRWERASLSNNIAKEPLGGTSNPCVDAGDDNDLLTGCSASMKNENKSGLSPEVFENTALCAEDQIQEHVVIQTNDNAKKTGVDKQDEDQDSSMDMFTNGELNIPNDVMTDCGNSEGLIDVNICDICGDVGREYLLATCTKCLEGAEHTYCMRVKLDKVPDGEWLCEECQLKDNNSNTRCKYGVQTVYISEGKKQSLENQNNPKALRVVPNLDAPQINCNTPKADQCGTKNKKLHLMSADTQPRQVKVTSPAAERLEVKNKKLLSMTNRKKLQVVTSDLEARSHTSGTSMPCSSNNKNQSSEFWLNCKKLRVSTDMESPLPSEGLRSPSISCKRLADNTSSSNPRLFKANSLKQRDILSRENSFKKSNEGSLSSLDNASVRNAQAVKSSQKLSRSYSMGSTVNAKAPVPSPRGLLSKQLSFNSSNNGPKVKQLVEGVPSKLRPSPKDPRDQGPIRKNMKSDSFKSEGSVCKDSGSSKQKQSFHVSQDEKSAILKSMKEKNMMERRASCSFKKPNIPSSPRPDSSMKSGERKLHHDISRPGPSILKTSKKPGNAEKESSDLSKSVKREINAHQKPTGFVSGKDIYTRNIPDPPVPPQCVKRDCSNYGEEDFFISVKDVPSDVLPTTSDVETLKSDLRDIVPRVGALEDSASKVVGCEQKPLESTVNSSGRDVGVAQASYDTLPETPHGLQIIHNIYPTDNKLDEPNLKQEAYIDQSTTENSSGDLVIPEQSYIWQGSFEISRHGIPEVFNGIQAYLSTCASFKVREVGIQLPHKIQLVEVPRYSSWPLQFKEVNPTEDSIALFFFAKDAESYEGPYGKLLEDMLLGDLSLIANIGGTELLIFPSDKLPKRTQCWNGLLFFWGIFSARKTSSLPELPATGTDNCNLPELAVTETDNNSLPELAVTGTDNSSLPELAATGTDNSSPPELPVTGADNRLEPITGPVIQHDECSPKVHQSLVIDLNECPNDDLSDPGASPKTGAAIDQNIWLESKHEDKKLNAREKYHEETAVTRHIVSGHTAAPCGTHFPKIPTEGCNMVKDYPSAAKGISGNGNVEEDGFCQHETFLCVAQLTGAMRSVSEETVVKKQAFQPSVEVSPRHFSGSKISDDPNQIIPKLGIGSSDPYSSYKRQKTYHEKHPACSFEELPSKFLSKIHPAPVGQQNSFDDMQYIYSAPSDPGSHKKPIPDHVIHVLSSDDEDSPELSTSLNNKASLKADEAPSPLLSLSLSTVATQHNHAGSDIGEDEPLSLSLGLPDVVEGSRVLEMKQFLPEKPGIDT